MVALTAQPLDFLIHRLGARAAFPSRVLGGREEGLLAPGQHLIGSRWCDLYLGRNKRLGLGSGLR